MERSEAEKLLQQYNDAWARRYLLDAYYQEGANNKRREIINALCAEPAAPMSFEEFEKAINDYNPHERGWRVEGEREKLRSIYNRMNHSADASNKQETYK